MKRCVGLALALLAVTPFPASAQQGAWPGPPVWVQQGGQPSPPPGARPDRERDTDRDRRERLTPDQRRELHRDLDRANREIYRKGRDRR